MIPITDDVKKNWIGPVTWLLIASTSIISILSLNASEDGQSYIVQTFTFSGGANVSSSEHFKRMISALFLHADYFHLFFNMLFLFAFGLTLEERLGALRYVVLYFGSGVLGWVAYDISRAQHFALGASGAISGIIATYLFLFPKAKFLSAVFVFWFVKFFYIRAWVYILMWIGVQVWSAKYDSSSSVAYSAHLGGIAFGTLFGAWSKFSGVSQEEIQ